MEISCMILNQNLIMLVMLNLSKYSKKWKQPL